MHERAEKAIEAAKKRRFEREQKKKEDEIQKRKMLDMRAKKIKR